MLVYVLKVGVYALLDFYKLGSFGDFFSFTTQIVELGACFTVSASSCRDLLAVEIRA